MIYIYTHVYYTLLKYFSCFTRSTTSFHLTDRLMFDSFCLLRAVTFVFTVFTVFNPNVKNHVIHFNGSRRRSDVASRAKLYRL